MAYRRWSVIAVSVVLGWALPIPAYASNTLLPAGEALGVTSWGTTSPGSDCAGVTGGGLSFAPAASTAYYQTELVTPLGGSLTLCGELGPDVLGQGPNCLGHSSSGGRGTWTEPEVLKSTARQMQLSDVAWTVAVGFIYVAAESLEEPLWTQDRYVVTARWDDGVNTGDLYAAVRQFRGAGCFASSGSTASLTFAEYVVTQD